MTNIIGGILILVSAYFWYLFFTAKPDKSAEAMRKHEWIVIFLLLFGLPLIAIPLLLN